MLKKWSFSIFLLLFAFTVASVYPQVATGNVTGSISDPSGARLPGVTVTIINVQTNLARTATTDERGEFTFTLLPVGEYRLEAELTGFKKKIVSGIVLRVDQTVSLQVALELGEIAEVAEVIGATPLLEKGTSSLGQVIENTYIVNLPLNGRNPYALGLLSGHAVPKFGHPTNQPFVAGGARFTANEFLIDGSDNRTFFRNIAYVPSVDAVQEFKVKTSSFSAEFGRSGGAVVNLVTKSGTNEFHGSFYEFIRNDMLDANSFFNNAAGIKKPPFRRNQFGGTFGGPIIFPRLYNGQNRTFFFIDYEGLRERTAAFSGFADVPPLNFRQGDFSNYRDARGNLIPIFDPATRRLGPQGTVIADQFPDNRIPSFRINAVAAAIANLIPAPNFGGPDAAARNFLRTAPRRFNGDKFDVRVDHSFSSSNNFFSRFSFANNIGINPDIFPPPLGGNVSTSPARNLVISDTHIFSPSVVNEFRFTLTRFEGSTVGASQDFTLPGMAKFPFPVQGLPNIAFNFSGERSGPEQFSTFGGAGSSLHVENTFQWSDNFTVTRGRHTVKTGMDLRRLRNDWIAGDVFFGRLIFGAVWTLSPQVIGSGAPFADFLLGLPSFIEGGQMLDWGRLRDIYFGGYIQDDWKMTQKLTLNLGVRYDLFTQPVDARDKGGFFDVSTARMVLPGRDGFSRAIVRGDHNNFAPRFGLAYNVRNHVVIRAGYGIFYGEPEKNPTSHRLAENPPNTPVFAIPRVDPARDLKPSFDITTPITAVPFDITFSGFSAARPISRTFFTPDFGNNVAQYLQQYQLSIQVEPWKDWLFEISYAGSQGRKLGSRFNLNQLPESFVLDGRNIQANRRFSFINGIMVLDGAYGSSDYNSMNLRVEKRYSHGLSLLANYSVQKHLEVGPTGVVGVFQQAGGTSLPLDSFDVRRRERGPSVLDVPQYFVLSYVYELPFGKGKPLASVGGVLNHLIGGWQINGITTLRGGFPTDIRFGRNVPNFSTHNVPDRVPGEPLQVKKPSVDQFFNPAAFAPAPTGRDNQGRPVQLYGNAAKRLARGPGSVNFDFGLFKNTKVSEQVTVQFRMEFFNLTNTPTFLLPSATSPTLTFGSPVFGKLSAASAVGRQIQFGLKILY